MPANTHHSLEHNHRQCGSDLRSHLVNEANRHVLRRHSLNVLSQSGCLPISCGLGLLGEEQRCDVCGRSSSKNAIVVVVDVVISILVSYTKSVGKKLVHCPRPSADLLARPSVRRHGRLTGTAL